MYSNTFSGIVFNLLLALVLVVGIYAVALPAQATELPSLPEFPVDLPECADLIDNDGDGLIDFVPVLGDPGCDDIFDDSEEGGSGSDDDDNEGENGDSDFECADLIDNDGDGLIDFLPVLGDPDCENIFDDSEGSEELVCDEGEVLNEDETECIPDEDDGGSNGGGGDNDDGDDDNDNNNGRSSGGRNGRSGGGNRGGEVLGVRTPECSATNPFLNGYLRIGWMNDTTEVMKLQAFLNGHMNAGLPITGHFGPETFAAVEAFQVKYWEEVLLPWVPFGLPTEKTPTGFVYKTTSRWINMMACPGLELPMPELP